MTTIAYPFVSADLTTAAAACGVSERTLRDAIYDGSLEPHYVGRRASKPLLLATDLAEWVASLPTERGNA